MGLFQRRGVLNGYGVKEGKTMEKKKIIEEVLKKFVKLDPECKEFALGYVTGKHDEKAAKAD